MTKRMRTLRGQIHAALPGLMEKALIGYRHFAAETQPRDPKGFAAHHAACRAALSHMELLVRLARWAETNEGNDEEINEDMAKLIAEARTALTDMVDEE